MKVEIALQIDKDLSLVRLRVNSSQINAFSRTLSRGCQGSQEQNLATYQHQYQRWVEQFLIPMIGRDQRT